MSDILKLISEEEVYRVHGNADFGSMTPRDVVNRGVLNVSKGWHSGSVMQSIILEHKLAWSRKSQSPMKLKPKGRRYLEAMKAEEIMVIS